jgi:hypothetical protein
MPRTPKICSIDDCQNISRAHGYCMKHYMRFSRHGSPLIQGQLYPSKVPSVCTLEFCNLQHYAKGLCNLHYIRQKRHGDPKKRLTNKGFTISTNGYKVIWSEGNPILEHRYIMQQHVGRPLSTDEIVHHVDGDKLNNNLENLRLLARGEHSSHHHAQGDVPQRHRIYDTLPCLVCGKRSKARQLCGTHHQAFLEGRLPASVTVPPPFYSPSSHK